MRRETSAIRRGAALLLPVLLLTLLLGGCMQAEEPESIEEESPAPPRGAEQERESVLLPDRFALPYEPNRTLDPITCPDGMQQVIGSLMFEGLFRLDPQLEPEPCLVDSYASDETFTHYTIVLKQGITFSDGSLLTAAEVRNSLERARNSDRYGARLWQISTMRDALDTLFITLSSPNSGFPALLDVPIVKYAGGSPIGTGPYYYAEEDYGAWLLANPDWWQGAAQPVDRIYLDESQGAMLYRFTSRDVQLIVTDLTGGALAGVTGDIRYQDTATTTLQYILCNTQRYPMTNPAFRRALSLGINRENLVSGFLSGHALATQFPVSPASQLYPSDLEDAYSAFSFSTALSESGTIPDWTLSLLVNAENPFKVSVAQSIAESFTAAGVPTETWVLPFEDYQLALTNGDYDLCYCETRLPADWNLSYLLAFWGPLNTTHHTDGILTELIDEFAASGDRITAMHNLCDYFRYQCPILPVCFNNSSVLAQGDVVDNLVSTVNEPFYNLMACIIHLRESGE